MKYYKSLLEWSKTESKILRVNMEEKTTEMQFQITTHANSVVECKEKILIEKARSNTLVKQVSQLQKELQDANLKSATLIEAPLRAIDSQIKISIDNKINSCLSVEQLMEASNNKIKTTIQELFSTVVILFFLKSFSILITIFL